MLQKNNHCVYQRVTCIKFHVKCFEGYHTEYRLVTVYSCYTLKGKVHPKRSHEGPKGEQRYTSTVSLTSKLDGVDDQCNAPATLSQERRPRTHCTGGWLSSKASLDGCRISRLHQDLIPRLFNP